MANLSIREAVKHYQVSRPTLTKALKSGKISGGQDEFGKWSIDPSELARIYQPRPLSQDTSAHNLPGKVGKDLTTLNTIKTDELDRLQTQLVELELRAVKAETRADAAELLAHERAERIDDLRRMLPAPEQVKKRWWQR